jgi:hypothetical protein
MMKEEFNNMDKIFREKLEGFSEEPPAFVWDNIQANLSGMRRRKRMVWYSWSAVAALLLLAFIAGWYFNESADRTTPRFAETEKIIPVEKNTPEEQIANVPEKDDVQTEKESMEADRFLAGATEKELLPQKSEEQISAAEMVEENSMLALANLSLIKPIEPDEIELAGRDQVSAPAKKHHPKPAEEIFSWERKVIDENVQLFSSDTEENKKWKLGLNVSPGYSSYAAKHGAVYASNMTSEASDGNASLSGGVSVQYKTGKRISIESGIYYAQNGQQTGSSPQLFGDKAEMEYTFAPADRNYFNTAVTLSGSRMVMNSTAGIIEFEDVPKGAEIAANLETAGNYSNSLLTSGELAQVFDFVEIPLYLRYLLIDRKIDVELVGGVNAGLVVGNNAYIDNEYGIQNIGKTSDISTVNVSGTVGVGLNYALGKNLSVAVEPRVNYYLNSINRNPEVDFRPYRVGVYTGLYYEF